MSHEFEHGLLMRTPAWHGLGIVLDEFPGRDIAQVLAGHNFEVVIGTQRRTGREIVAANLAELIKSMRGEDTTTLDALFADLENVSGEFVITEDGVFAAKEIEGFKVLEKKVIDPATMLDARTWAQCKEIAESQKYELLLPGHDTDGIVFNEASDTYGIAQNDRGWDIIEAFLGQENVRYETALSLRDGAVCSVLAYLDEPVTIPGDNSPVLNYINVSWAHDGSGAVSARSTRVRTVCMNTQSLAEMEAERLGTVFTFRHTANIDENIEAAKAKMKGLKEENAAFAEIATELAGMSITEKQREFFVTEFIPKPPEYEISDRVAANVEQARAAVRSLFDLDRNKTIPEDHTNTCYGLWLAGTEYLDHIRPHRAKTTLYNRTLMKDEPMKRKLMGLVRECATA